VVTGQAFVPLGRRSSSGGFFLAARPRLPRVSKLPVFHYHAAMQVPPRPPAPGASRCHRKGFFMRRPLLASALAVAFFLPLTAQPYAARAQDAKQEADAAIEKAIAGNPYKEKMQQKAQQLSAALSEKEVQDLAVLLQSFGMVRSVRVAHDKVNNAVDKCAEANGDLKADITDRYKDWDGRLTPKIALQEKRMEDVLSSSRFAHAQDVRDYLDLIDDAAKYADEQQKTEVVTTPEACKSLMESMDKTGPVLAKILTDMKWPGDPGVVPPQIPGADAGAKEKAPGDEPAKDESGKDEAGKDESGAAKP
jgi:hypothetical protein